MAHVYAPDGPTSPVISCSPHGTRYSIHNVMWSISRRPYNVNRSLGPRRTPQTHRHLHTLRPSTTPPTHQPRHKRIQIRDKTRLSEQAFCPALITGASVRTPQSISSILISSRLVLFTQSPPPLPSATHRSSLLPPPHNVTHLGHPRRCPQRYLRLRHRLLLLVLPSRLQPRHASRHRRARRCARCKSRGDGAE